MTNEEIAALLPPGAKPMVPPAPLFVAGGGFALEDSSQSTSDEDSADHILDRTVSSLQPDAVPDEPSPVTQPDPRAGKTQVIVACTGRILTDSDVL